MDCILVYMMLYGTVIGRFPQTTSFTSNPRTAVKTSNCKQPGYFPKYKFLPPIVSTVVILPTAIFWLNTGLEHRCANKRGDKTNHMASGQCREAKHTDD
jgi:hypothetical protein